MVQERGGGGAVGSKYCYNQNFEYMFVFSKGRPKAVNLICDVPNKFYGKNIVTGRVTGRRLPNGTLRHEQRKPNKPYSRRNNWWYYVPAHTDLEKTGNHPAVFPEPIVHGHIISWSNEGDLVFDPMCGSGTTGAVALRTKRNFIGFDISTDYIEIARRRIEREVPVEDNKERADSIGYEA